MKVLRINRRHFLRGATGFTLALPLLPSLMPRAQAGEFPFSENPRFVSMATNHGGVWAQNMYPADSAASTTVDLFADHQIHHGDLTRTVEGGDGVVSPLLRGAQLTESIASKMNVIRGLDIMFYIAHHTGGHLGNYARNDGNGGDRSLPFLPTIDQVMAWSDSFYSDLTSIRERSIHIGRGEGRSISWGHSEPSSHSGDVVYQPTIMSSMALFDSIFVPTDTMEMPRPPVVDRVLENYNRLRSGAFGDANRLSADDKQRLDDHMDRLSELQRRLGVSVASCGDLAPPTRFVEEYDRRLGGYSTDVLGMSEAYGLYNDVIVAAFICGTTRIATIYSDEMWSDHTDGDSWHEAVAHQAANDPAMQNVMVASQRRFFQSVFLDLASKLDVVEANDQTYLDNTLMMWTQESGITTHNSDSMPVVTAGSAAGVLETGRYFDYRNRPSTGLHEDWYMGIDLERRPGVSYNQWLGTILTAMGVPQSEYSRPDFVGYGLSELDSPRAYPSRILDMANSPLPLIMREG